MVRRNYRPVGGPRLAAVLMVLDWKIRICSELDIPPPPTPRVCVCEGSVVNNQLTKTAASNM